MLLWQQFAFLFAYFILCCTPLIALNSVLCIYNNIHIHSLSSQEATIFLSICFTRSVLTVTVSTTIRCDIPTNLYLSCRFLYTDLYPVDVCGSRLSCTQHTLVIADFYVLLTPNIGIINIFTIVARSVFHLVGRRRIGII